MIRSKYISIIVAVCVCLALAGSLFMVSAAASASPATPNYQKMLFNGETVEIEIEADEEDWQNLLDNAQAKEYIAANIVINGERFSTIGIRTKGNSSLNQTGDSDRYSLHLNPSYYVSGQSFYGLDTMCLNNLMGDATYMKDYISYEIMDYLDVPAPLHNYARITVNGEYYGLFLLLERYDDSFLDRVYGASTGELYNVKIAMGERSAFADGEGEPQRPGNTQATGDEQTETPSGEAGGMPDFGDFGGFGDFEGFEGMAPPDMGSMELPFGDGESGWSRPGDESADDGAALPQGETPALPDEATGETPDSTETSTTPAENSGRRGGDMGGMMMGGGFSSGGSSLVYTDDDPESYSSIFDNAVSNKVSDNDKQQVITAIQKLNEGESLEEYWDVDEILRYLAAHTFVVNLDSYVSSMQQNYYLLEREGVLSVLPWDYNLAFGGFTSRDAEAVVNFAIDTPVSGVNMEDRPLVSQLLAVDEYRELYHEYLNEIVTGYVNSGLFEETVDRVDAQINADVATDTTAYFTHEEYEASLPVFKELVLRRAESVAGQLDGSVPSTTEEQNSNPDALVSADDIDLTALGTSMGGGGGGGDRTSFAGGGFGGGMPGGEGQTSTGDISTMPNMEDMLSLFEAAQNGTLTEEQSEQLAALGITEDQLTQTQNRFGAGMGAGGNIPDDNTGETGNTQGSAMTMPFAADMGGQTSTAATPLAATDWVIYGVLGIALAVAIVLMARYSRRKWHKPAKRAS